MDWSIAGAGARASCLTLVLLAQAEKRGSLPLIEAIREGIQGNFRALAVD